MAGPVYSGLFSHPGKPLELHLVNVARLARDNAVQAPAWDLLQGLSLSPGIFSRLAALCGLCHDLGKATGYFQEYLFAEGSRKKHLQGLKETKHSFLSSIATYLAAREVIPQGVEMGEVFAFFAYQVVRRHHGNLKDVLIDATLQSTDLELLQRQIDSIDRGKYDALCTQLIEAEVPPVIEFNYLRNKISEIPTQLEEGRRKLRRIGRKGSNLYYFANNLLFSLLTDADKSEVAIGAKLPERSLLSFPPSYVDKYKEEKGLGDHSLNALREQAYREVLANTIDLKKRIFSLNLPTGLGKTFASLAFAFELREKVFVQKGYYPRIVYSLPFLSIIEQNASEIEKILQAGGLRADSNLLLKHHYFADLYYKMGEDEFEPQQAKILIEGWNAEIVVTTFIQLFHTLIGYRNRQLRKFHRLAGSIIILDEVQAIPFKYWPLVKGTLMTLAEKMDSYILFVTATEPLIFKRQETTPLVDRGPYFKKLNRVTVLPDIKEKKGLVELLDEIRWEEGERRLFIFNTITAAKDFYNLLQEATGKEPIFLSTHITPRERLERIKLLREGKVPLAVTTQLVEAGVDIDFPIVHRDLAPLDSINQSAGRCNRHGDGSGRVYVHYLYDGSRTYASYIYDSILLDITREILQKYEVIPESDFLRLIEEYYQQLVERKSAAASQDLLKALHKLKYDGTREDGSLEEEYISTFRLIKEDYPKIDVFIEINEEAAVVWKEYQRVKEITNLMERKTAFAQIKSRFFQYVISVPAAVDNIPPEVNGFRYVGRENLSEYYHPVTGFKTKGVASLW